MIKSRIYALHGMQDLKQYISPSTDTSLWTSIDIKHLESVRELLRTYLPEQYTYRIRFQGPRYGQHKMSTNKVNAIGFLVYVDYRMPKKPNGFVATSHVPAPAAPSEFIWNNGYKYRLCVL
jgi:hypothetical protein